MYMWSCYSKHVLLYRDATAVPGEECLVGHTHRGGEHLPIYTHFLGGQQEAEKIHQAGY